MDNNFNQIQFLLRNRAELQARLNLIPYEGTVEIKSIADKKYLYVRKRIANKVKSIYVGVYSEELYIVLLRQVKDAKDIKKKIREIEKELAKLNYNQEELSNQVILNLDFARANMKSLIYDQAILEGISTTFPDTEAIIDNGKVNNMSTEDVMKIINLKHAWEFILDKDVILSPTNYYVSQYIAKLINEGFYFEGGRIRQIPVNIGGSTYKPPLPIENVVREKINIIINSTSDDIDKAIELTLFVMKTQVFIDGNKRTAIIFANHYLISKGMGLLAVPFELVPEFKKLLIAYYEDYDTESIKQFLKEKCWRKLNN
jgi:prophage maintenance system killer protein